MFSDQYSICCFEVDLIKQFLALLNRFSYFCDSLDFLCFVGVSLYARNKKIQNIQKLVGSSGLEPPTSRLSGVRSNHLSYEPMLLSSVCLSYLFPLHLGSGGDERDRTDDPLLAKQVLSQLSYTPVLELHLKN